MEKIIKIDILEEHDLIDKYDCESINPQLLEYIIKKTMYVRSNEQIKIVINNKCKTKINIAEKIMNSLETEYESIYIEHYRNNIIQLMLLCLGILFIFLSTLISEGSLWKEVILIIGWVPIWEMVDLELFKDFTGRKRKRIISKLLTSEIVEN